VIPDVVLPQDGLAASLDRRLRRRRRPPRIFLVDHPSIYTTVSGCWTRGKRFVQLRVEGLGDVRHGWRVMNVSNFFRCVIRAAAIGIMAAGLTQCATKKPTPTAAVQGGYYDVKAKRPNNPAAVRVFVSTSTQRVYVTEGDRMLLVSPACVGTAAKPTPQGNFRVTLKLANKRRISNPGAGYPMPNWVEFKPAYGFHGGWIHPYPASHGCVRLPWKVSSKFFNLVRPGTPINIATSQPYDAQYASTVTQPDERPTPEWPASMLNSGQIFLHCGPGHLE